MRCCHARCFQPTAFAPRHAAVAPAARFAELEVVRRCYARPEMNITWQSVSREFEPDGSLRDIYVSPATPHDWQRVLDFVRQHGSEVCYSLDGQSTSVPVSVDEPFAAREHSSPLLTFRFGGIHFAAHFFCDDEVEFDIVPNDIRSASEFDSLCGFLQRIGDLLSKPVSLTPENCGEDAFLVYHPNSREFSHAPSAFNRNA